MPIPASLTGSPPRHCASARANRDGGGRDQRDLKQCDQRLGLAVPKTVIVIGGLSRKAHCEQRRHRCDQINAAIGK